MRLPLTWDEKGIYKELYSVCRISSNYDETIAKITSDALNIVGIEGFVEIEESPTGKTSM